MIFFKDIKNKKKIFIIKTSFIIIILYTFIKIIFMNTKFLNNIIVLISYINVQIEISNIEKVLLIKNNKNRAFKKYKKYNNPKISIISPVYNSEKYLLKFLRNIQDQNFIEIEIILVDDCSIDNSVKIIEKYKFEDKRIILIHNKNNKGTFVTRNIGILFSKGKYSYIITDKFYSFTI